MIHLNWTITEACASVSVGRYDCGVYLMADGSWVWLIWLGPVNVCDGDTSSRERGMACIQDKLNDWTEKGTF